MITVPVGTVGSETSSVTHTWQSTITVGPVPNFGKQLIAVEVGWGGVAPSSANAGETNTPTLALTETRADSKALLI